MPAAGPIAACAPVQRPPAPLAPARACGRPRAGARPARHPRGAGSGCASRPHARARRAGVACGAATLENEFAVQEDELEDFYQLLGVVRRPHWAFASTAGTACSNNEQLTTDNVSAAWQAPTASEREIKQAYRNSMRSCHPDFAIASGEEDEESATTVCVFLNDIVEVGARRYAVLRLALQVAAPVCSTGMLWSWHALCKVHLGRPCQPLTRPGGPRTDAAGPGEARRLRRAGGLHARRREPLCGRGV